MTGSPRRGCSDSEGPEKRSTPVTDPFVGDGATRSPVSLGNSFLCSALMSGRGSRIRISLLARTAQEIAILENPIIMESLFELMGAGLSKTFILTGVTTILFGAGLSFLCRRLLKVEKY